MASTIQTWKWPQPLGLVVCLIVSLMLMGFSFGGGVKLELSHLETVPCPDTAQYANMVVSSGSSADAADCYFIQGTIANPTDQVIYNADVFGRLYDANDNDIWPERTRLGAVEEVPPGESPFSIRISVPTTSPLPLSLKSFKASGFRGAVRR